MESDIPSAPVSAVRLLIFAACAAVAICAESDPGETYRRATELAQSVRDGKGTLPEAMAWLKHATRKIEDNDVGYTVSFADVFAAVRPLV